MIGGELSFASKSQNYSSLFGPSKVVTYTIAPQFGYGLPANWIIGAGAGYAYQYSKTGTSNSFTKETQGVFTFSLFVRKFHPFNDKIGIYGQLDAAMGFGKGKQTQVQGNVSAVTYNAKVQTISPLLRPGLYFWATKRIIIEAVFGGIGYTYSTVKPDNNIKLTVKEFNFTLTSSFGLGFEVAF